MLLVMTGEGFVADNWGTVCESGLWRVLFDKRYSKELLISFTEFSEFFELFAG